MPNPFTAPPSQPGEGTIHLALLPPSTPRLQTLKYQYPLKLISPAPIRVTSSLASSSTNNNAAHRDAAAASFTEEDHLVHTIYLLTYGGGLVAGDTLSLSVHLSATTRLVLLTQGSTKLFRTPDPTSVLTAQKTATRLGPGSALCWLPDPVQPFAKSAFRQAQGYEVVAPAAGLGEGMGLGVGSLCVLDWVSAGRTANGEDWDFWTYGSRNEVWLVRSPGTATDTTTTAAATTGDFVESETKRLLLRDNVLLTSELDDEGAPMGLADRMHNVAVFGTLILYGPLVAQLAAFFMEEFALLPRIGGRGFSSSSDSGNEDEEPEAAGRAKWRKGRVEREAREGVLWSAARVRGCVVVKFGARSVEGGRQWLREMLVEDGSVQAVWGERALLCLK